MRLRARACGEFRYSKRINSLTVLPCLTSGRTFRAMRGPWLLLVDRPSAVARLLGPVGAKAPVAENLLIKQQLLVLARSHWVLVVKDPFTRRIIGVGVQAGGVDGMALRCMFNNAISKQRMLWYLSSDNDPFFRHRRWKAKLRILETDEIKPTPYSPRWHPFVERPIGTIHRESLDHVSFWNARDLRQKLACFATCCNQDRPHHSLDGRSPAVVSGETHKRRADIRDYSWQRHLNGFFRLPVSA